MENERVRYGRRISALSICINVLLAASKMICGALAGLVSVFADGVNNFSDAASGIVSYIGFRLAERPADDEHPFGHARSEYIAGLTVSFLVLLAGIELFKSGAEKLMAPGHESLSLPALAVMALSLCAKGALVYICRKGAALTGSGTIRAVGSDSLTDCLVTSAVMISAVISHAAGVNLDGWATLLVAVFVFIGGVGLIRDTMRPLMGVQPSQELVDSLKICILSYEGVLGIHDLMIHDYGPGHIFASVHAEVPAQSSVESCHAVIDSIERDVLENMHVHLLIHYDPVEDENPLETRLAESIRLHVPEIPETMTLHDVRAADGKLYFDAVIPQGVKRTDAEIIELLTRASVCAFPEYTPAISIDHGLIALDNDSEDRN